MAGGPGWRLAMAAREPDQAGRLLRFCDEHPGVHPEPAEFGACEAWIPSGNGGRLIVGRSLRELLDRLEAAFCAAPDPRAAPLPPGGGTGAGTDSPG